MNPRPLLDGCDRPAANRWRASSAHGQLLMGGCPQGQSDRGISRGSDRGGVRSSPSIDPRLTPPPRSVDVRCGSHNCRRTALSPAPSWQFPQCSPQNLCTWLSTGREGFLTAGTVGRPTHEQTSLPPAADARNSLLTHSTAPSPRRGPVASEVHTKSRGIPLEINQQWGI